MTLLVVSPDYASHLLPLLQIARRWLGTRGEVVVATGPATRHLVEAAGVAWTDLRLGRGRNAGVIEVADQPAGEDAHLQAFFDATRAGPIATLTYQADARRHDLLYDPDGVLDRLGEIVRDVRPQRVVVDHVAFGARLALHALGVPAVSVVLGHPSALPAPGEVYGLPSAWPAAITPDPTELETLRRRCRESVDELAAAAAEVLARRAPGRPPIGDLTSRPSPDGLPTVYASPLALHDPARALPPRSVFVGSLARAESIGETVLPAGDGPLVLVALGSFLGARDDVLATAVRAANQAGWRLAIATGSTPVERLGALPPGALVARHLPQVALLGHADVFVNHGGNGSVTEAAAAGVPQVVLPFSTDQFALAAAVESVGVGSALSPNGLTVEQLVASVTSALAPSVRRRAGELAEEVASSGGAAAAVAAIAAG
ncbi:MAG: nucleotide disphospho-sugar-binding domain-containing protein [Actinomycetes bacterium]